MKDSDMSSSKKAERQLKELRRLMPWTWDSRVEEHPPGEKAMHDFEDIVNYRVGARKRRNGVPDGGEGKVVGKKKMSVTTKKNKKKSKLVSAQEIDDSNKENIPPDAQNVPAIVEVAVVEEKKECDMKSPNVDKAKSSPACGENTPALVKAKTSIVLNDTPAAISPGLMLTPASNTKSLVQEQQPTRLKKEQTLSRDVSTTKSLQKAIRSEIKKQTRKVTFACSPSQGTDSATHQSTGRIVRFNDNFSIDLAKYGSALKMKRPSGCPPLFRTLPDHGRRVVPPGRHPTAGVQLDGSIHGASRRATPYMNSDEKIFSREQCLTKFIREGLNVRDSTVPLGKPLRL